MRRTLMSLVGHQELLSDSRVYKEIANEETVTSDATATTTTTTTSGYQ